MPTLTFPSTIVGGTTEDVSQLNANLTAIQQVVNSIDDANIAATAGIQESKLATGINGLAQGTFSAWRSTIPATSLGPTVIVFDSEEFDLSSWHDVATGRYTPQVPGYYRLSAGATFNSTGAGASETLDLYKNGAIAKRLDSDAFASATIGLFLHGSVVVQANGTTDFFDVRWSGSAATAPLSGASATYFQGERIGRS